MSSSEQYDHDDHGLFNRRVYEETGEKFRPLDVAFGRLVVPTHRDMSATHIKKLERQHNEKDEIAKANIRYFLDSVK